MLLLTLSSRPKLALPRILHDFFFFFFCLDQHYWMNFEENWEPYGHLNENYNKHSAWFSYLQFFTWHSFSDQAMVLLTIHCLECKHVMWHNITPQLSGLEHLSFLLLLVDSLGQNLRSVQLGRRYLFSNAFAGRLWPELIKAVDAAEG